MIDVYFAKLTITSCHYFFAVFADCLNALEVGAPGLPGLRIFSPEPALMRSCFAWMFA
jgi:hypothetical protein